MNDDMVLDYRSSCCVEKCRGSCEVNWRSVGLCVPKDFFFPQLRSRNWASAEKAGLSLDCVAFEARLSLASTYGGAGAKVSGEIVQ